MRVGLQALYPDLPPLQQTAVGEVPHAVDSGAAEPFLHRTKIVNGDDPAKPATALQRSCPDSLAERCLVRCGMIKNLHHLEILAVGQRQDPVARTEARVEPAIVEWCPQCIAQALSCAVQSLRSGRKRQMIQMHGAIVALARPTAPGGGSLRRP
ncbi:hypothetical protein GCM10009841_27140 [Microlunatus panaciterrae]